jgi:hypothetical protein
VITELGLIGQESRRVTGEDNKTKVQHVLQDRYILQVIGTSQ